MRGFLILLSAALLSQAQTPTTPSSKPGTTAAAHPVHRSTAASTTAKSRSAATRSAPAKTMSKSAAPALTTDEQKTIYSLGLSIYKSLAPFDLSPAELELVKRSLSDAAAGKPAVDLDTWKPRIQSLFQARQARAADKEKEASKAYIAKAAAEPGSLKTESGLVYHEVRTGLGASPQATDTVKVHYRGTLLNGTEFDSSYKRNEPAEFPLNGVIPCWTEGVQKMKVGGKATLVCPSNLAYGDAGHPPTIPGGATLVFEIELLEIVGHH